MEFKYRDIDNNRPPTTTSFPVSTVTYVSDRSLIGAAAVAGGFPSMPNTFRVAVGGGGSEALRRELEKEQIRREIIAGEIARRRELEEEVRRELALERALGMGIPMQRSLASASAVAPWCVAATTWSNPGLNPVAAVDDLIGVSHSQPQLQQIMAPSETKPSPHTDEDKVIMLAKPNPDLYSAKRKAVTPAVCGAEPSAFGLKKKLKEDWSCELCQVSATSERGLKEHLRGKKHKAKEAALKSQKIGKSNGPSLSLERCEKIATATETIITATSGLDAKPDRQASLPSITLGDIKAPQPTIILEDIKAPQPTMILEDIKAPQPTMILEDIKAPQPTIIWRDIKGPQPSITLEEIKQLVVNEGVMESKNEEQVQKSQNVGGLENQDGTATEEAVKIILSRRRKREFRCEICQIITFSQAVMEDHKRGRKHLKRMQTYSQNNESSPPTPSSQEAPGLIKDTAAVNKETDQMITPVPNEEAIREVAEFFSNPDEVHPVAESRGDRADEGL